MELFKNANYPFMRWRKGYLVFSVTLCVLAIIILIGKGINYGIDFKGGSFVHVRFKEMPDMSKVRSAFVNAKELGTVEIKQYGSKETHELMIGIQKQDEGSGATYTNKVTTLLQKEFADGFEVLRQESVGPKVGDELKWKAILSIFLSLIAIILYIWFRFQFRFGIASVIPLFHDVLITLGVFVAMGLEVNLPIVAAFLTLIGYSLNDTIVVFDRVRENLAKDQKSNVTDIIERSINETLSRTINTVGTVLVTLLALYFLGVSVIKDFAFALIVGIIFGTYSSIGVASAILASWTPETLRRAKFKSA